uniref:G protein subunit beta 1 like n=1 Tax=Leptobrachium leishanense TaxID=445787 RepID=A0A8C5MBL9_9ANUR
MTLPPPDPKFELRGTGAEINCLKFSCGAPSPCPPLLFSGTSSGLVHLWDLRTRRTITALDGHDGKSVYWIQTIHDKDSILSQGRDLQICTWSLAEGRNEVIDTLPLENVGFCKSSLLMTDPPLLAMPGKEGSQVQVLDLLSKKLVSSMNPEEGSRWGMAMSMHLWQPVSGSSPMLLVGYEDGSVALWNVLQHRMVSRLASHTDPIMSLDFDCKQARGVSGSADNSLNVWKLDEQQNLKAYKTQMIVNPGISDIALRPDRKILATGGWDYRVRIFSWKTMKPLAVLQYHKATVHAVCFSDHLKPEDRLLAAGSKDQRITLWSIYTES